MSNSSSLGKEMQPEINSSNGPLNIESSSDSLNVHPNQTEELSANRSISSSSFLKQNSATSVIGKQMKRLEIIFFKFLNVKFIFYSFVVAIAYIFGIVTSCFAFVTSFILTN